MFLIACDVVMLSVTNTLHLPEEDQEDLINILLLVIHGLVIMTRFAVVMLSVSGTKQFRAGLFGELLKMTWKPLAALTLHIGVMPMSWVYRRWILKDALYWDDLVYRAIASLNLISFFFSVYWTMYMHTLLSNATNYEAVGQHTSKITPSLDFLLGFPSKK